MTFLSKPAVIRVATAILIATWIGQGIIAVTHTPSPDSGVEGTVEHLQLALITLSALAMIPIVMRLGELAGARRAAILSLVGANAIGALCVFSNINSGDASFFNAVAVPSMLAWFVGFVILAVAMGRTRAVPRAYAVGLVIAFLLGGPFGNIGGGFVAALYWALLAFEIGIWSDAPAVARRPAASADPAPAGGVS
ncbi:MAG: hypothetical protein ACRDKE_03440 [Solirubrobacterales bacterium]